MGIAPRFALLMSIALVAVMIGAGFFLANSARSIVDNAVTSALDEAAIATREKMEGDATTTQVGEHARTVRGNVMSSEVEITRPNGDTERGRMYAQQKGGGFVPILVAPIADESEDPIRQLYGLFFAVTGIVILAGAAVAYGVAIRVARPLSTIVDDVRAIAHGNLHHRTRAQGGGEVALLASAIDRMSASLEEAQEAELELSIREREREVALEVQEALLPGDPPSIGGYELAARHVGAAEPGGDFHDFVERPDGRVALLVCDVSGDGVPGALVGATARAYLRGALERGEDLEAALRKVNREVARDVRRGMYVTALVVELDPEGHGALVACAGHKLPLLLSTEGKVRAVHPEGIALGFDKGPVFDRSLQVARLSIEPGDRLVLASTGAVRVQDPDDEEIGEKRFYRLIARNGQQPPAVLIEAVASALESFADGTPYPDDVSIVVLARDGS